MTHLPIPDDAESLNCDICTREIPADSMHSSEIDDYVVHYCGIECYEKWKLQQEEAES